MGVFVDNTAVAVGVISFNDAQPNKDITNKKIKINLVWILVVIFPDYVYFVLQGACQRFA